MVNALHISYSKCDGFFGMRWETDVTTNLSFFTEQLAGGRGQFRCPECRREVVSPDEGFPICFISEYLRDHINKAPGISAEQDKPVTSSGGLL